MVDLERLRPRMPYVFHTKLRLALSQTLDTLLQIGEHLEDLTAGRPPEPELEWDILTGGGRELAIGMLELKAMCDEGLDNRQIARNLGISEPTVKRRRARWGLRRKDYRGNMSVEELSIVSISVSCYYSRTH